MELSNQNLEARNLTNELSRITNATRDTAMSFVAFRKADARLAAAIKDAREAGASEPVIDRAMQNAASNPRTRAALEEYLEEIDKVRNGGNK